MERQQLKMSLPAFLTATVIVHAVSGFCPVKDTELFPDYYWRDYVGIIPKDAIEGGTDQDGQPTYIGQAYITGFEVLPVTIVCGSKVATATAYGLERTTDKNIKILCSKTKERFQWVETKSDEQHLLIEHHFVVGGSEIGHSLNIGRAKHDGRLLTGKVFSYPLPNMGLAVPYKRKPLVFQEYEILTYNVSRSTYKTPLEIDIDVRSN